MKQPSHYERLAALVATGRESLGVALEHSRTRDICDTVLRWIGASAIARRLTAASTPVTVDLRETATLGPLLRGGDRLRAAVAETAWAETLRGWERAGTSLLEHRPVATVSLVGLAALVANTLVTFALGDLTRFGIGLRLVAIAPFLLGKRSRATGEDVRESVLGGLLGPGTHRENDSE
jgi:hypothetical protein